jgi:DNA mismatch repair ATPase MutL
MSESTTATTEAGIDSSSTETTTETLTTSASSTESGTSETQEPSTTESLEQSTTSKSQGQSTTESQESSGTESTSEFQEQSTTESQQESTSESQEQSTTESQEQSTQSGAVTPCPIGNLTDEQIILVCPTGFRRHPKYCNLFYQCISEGNMEIKILVLSCPDNMIFDENKVQCLPEETSSQSCTSAKASARFYRTLENNALSPVSIFKSNNRLIC